MKPTIRSAAVRRSLRALAVACLAGSVGVVVWPAAVGAERPEVTAYWNRLKPDLPPQAGNPVPPPPDVPQNGLLVANDPSGPQAISALRFLASEPTEAVLALRAATGSNLAAATILACPITSQWDQEIDGAWANRPETDCVSGKSVEGVPSDTGDVMTWDIGPGFFREGVLIANIEIALVPDGSVPFRAVFAPPDDQALTADGPLYQPPTFGDTGPPPTFAPPVTAAPAGPTGTFSPGSGFGSGSGTTFAPAPTTTPTTLPPASGDETALSRPVVSDVPVPDNTADRILAGVLLAVLGGGLLWATTQQPAPEPKLIGGMANRAASRAASRSAASAEPAAD